MEWIISRMIEIHIKENRFYEIQLLLEPYLLEERKRIISQKVKKTSLLYTAVECQNLKIIHYLLYDCGADPNDTGYEMGWECPCLWKAVDLNDPEIAEILVEHGADVNGRNLLDTTALFMACRNGVFKMVKFLLQNGADINSCNHEGVTCLMASISYPEICTYLISLGADVNKISVLGDSALMMAIEDMEIDTIKVLLRSGADITITNNCGENAIFLAAKERLQIAPKCISPEDQLVAKCRALASEISSCQYAVLGEESLANVNWQRALNLRNLPEQTPMHQFEITPVQSELLPFKNFINSRDEEILLFLESRLGLRNPYTIDILTWAIYKTERLDEYAILFNLLITLINSTDNQLFFEMYFHINVLIINFIVRNRFEDDFETAFSCFRVIFNGIVDHLKNLSRRITSMNVAARSSKFNLMESYMHLIFDLITVIDRQCQERMKPLLEKLSEILKFNLRGRQQMSLLHFCIDREYRPDIARMLLSAGADINTMDDHGLTPAHYAVTSSVYCTKDTFDSFLNHGLQFTESSEENPCFPCELNKKDLLRQPLRYSSLQCLAANVVAKNFDTTKIHLPKSIQIIIHSHKS